MKKIFQNIFFLGSSDLISRFLSFLSIIFLARNFGPEGMGLLAASLSFLTIGNVLSELGLPIWGTKIISRLNKNSKDLLIKIFKIRFSLSIIIYIIFVIILKIYFFQSKLYLLSLIYLFALIPTSFLTEWVFQGLQNFKIISKGRILASTTYFFLIILFINEKSELTLIPIAWIVSILIQVLYLGIKNFKSLKIKQEKIAYSDFEILKKALPLGLSTIIAQVIIQFPPIYLGYFNSYEGGLFNIAFRVIILLLIINRIIYSLFFPTITRLIHTDKIMFETYFNIILKCTVFFSIIIGIFGIQIPSSFFSFIFGVDFKSSANIFQILCYYFIFSLINSILTYTLIGLDNEKTYLRSLIIGGLGFIFFFLFVDIDLAIKSSFSLVVFQFISLLIMLIQLIKKIKFNFFRSITLPFILLFIFSYFQFAFDSNHSNYLLFIKLIFFPLILFFIINISKKDRVFLINNIK
tara:strand:- start:64101 stop:65495 length:1395 start_codon:yes stop_codon:yes gene_type:complete